jgi:hypothetical protein
MAQRTSVSVVIAAPRSEVVAIVCDVAGYLEWASDVKSITIDDYDATGRVLQATFRAAAFGRSTTYSLRYNYDDLPNAVHWHQVRGDLMTSMSGRYQFDERDDQTLVTFAMEAELGVPLPGFVKHRAQRRIEQTALEDLKMKAER